MYCMYVICINRYYICIIYPFSRSKLTTIGKQNRASIIATIIIKISKKDNSSGSSTQSDMSGEHDIGKPSSGSTQSLPSLKCVPSLQASQVPPVVDVSPINRDVPSAWLPQDVSLSQFDASVEAHDPSLQTSQVSAAVRVLPFT